MKKTIWFGVAISLMLFLAACSTTPSVTSVVRTPQPTATAYPTNETLHISEWLGIIPYVGTPIFSTTITDGAKIEGTWSTITHLDNILQGDLPGCALPTNQPNDNFDFRFYQDQIMTREVKTVVSGCDFWNATSTQWTTRQTFFNIPQQFPRLWQTLHDLTGVPIPTTE